MKETDSGVTEKRLSVTSNAHVDADRFGGGLLDASALDVAENEKGVIPMNYSQVRNPEGLYRTMCRRAESYDIRQAKAKKRRKFGYDALKLDDVLKDENGDERENAALGDGGRGEAAIIEQVSILTDGIEPLDTDDVSWQEEFQKVVDKLDEKELAILNALKEDYTDRGAAKLVGGISHMKVHRFKAKLHEMLLPAYRAWKRRGVTRF